MTDHPRIYIATLRGLPIAASTDISTVQDAALTDRTRSTTTDQYENRWDQASPTEWQLMTRRTGTRRYSWTHRSIHSVPQLPAP